MLAATKPLCLTTAFCAHRSHFSRGLRVTTFLKTMKTESSFAAPRPAAALMDVRKQMEKDGKRSAVVPAGAFLGFVGLLVPTWVTVLLPLSLGYQAVKVVYHRLLAPPKAFVPISPFDSGYTVAPEDIIPRSNRSYDVVVIGATGFVGELATRYLAKKYGVNKEVKWAIAGRSQTKLEEMKRRLAKELDMEDMMSIECIVADTSIPSTMPNLVRNTKVLLTTAGPFWQYGNAVVEFCAKFGTHYADITGETSWVRNMMDRWHDTAQKTGAKIISLAGHDSIPWDLSVTMVAKQLKEETGEDLASITCFDEQKGGISGGSLATIMLLLGGPAPEGPNVDPFRRRADGSFHDSPVNIQLKMYPSKLVQPWDRRPAFGSPYLMSGVNSDVVAWSQALRGGTPLTYSEVLVSPDFKTAFVSYFSLVVLFTGLLNPITKYLFTRFILPKPGEGPSLEDMENNSFLTVTSEGIGAGGSRVQAAMYFPRDAGYIETATMLVETGLCMALEEESLSIQGGGFFSPGYGLGETLLNRLTKTGTYFQSNVVNRTDSRS